MLCAQIAVTYVLKDIDNGIEHDVDYSYIVIVIRSLHTFDIDEICRSFNKHLAM